MEEDRLLVSGILDGDMQAFKRLIRQNEKLVARMVGRVVRNREDMEEICQDVFIRVYQKITEFNFRAKLSTWIAAIAYRMAISHVRKRKLIYGEIDEATGYLTDPALNPDMVTEDRDMDELVIKLTERLPAAYKSVLLLYHTDGLGYSEISQITGMPEGTVKSYIFRARNLLKNDLIKYIGKEALS
jgi:RNA polymerase sigma-70 factor (ECF subfamily)